MANTVIDQTGEILNFMDTISLEGMDHVVLMKRTDTKYVLPAEKIPSILKEISDSYKVLEIEGVKMQQYHTVYYDTPDFAMYHHHHNKRLNRYKIRVREYVSSGITFLEVKFKNNKQETIKKRIKPGDSMMNLVNGSGEFLLKNSPYGPEDLKASLENSFFRITLVNKIIPERITIDLDLRYQGIGKERNVSLPDISVIEVKRNRDADHSEIIKALRYRHIQPMGFSKYCMGTALTQPGVKTNLFRKRIRILSKIDKNFILQHN